MQKMKLTSNSVIDAVARAWLVAHLNSLAQATKASANAEPYGHCCAMASSTMAT